jgi:hypothetical protein
VKPLGVACAELVQWGRPWCSYRTPLGCGERKAAPHKKLSLSLSKHSIRNRREAFLTTEVNGIACRYHVAPGRARGAFTKEMGHRMAHPPSATTSSHLPCSISRQQKPRAYANSFLWAGAVLCSFK